MLGPDLATFITRVVVLLIAFPIHELAHAVSATYFGDHTPESQGRLTLNPLAHLDPMGTLMLVFAGFGWAKPVMVNEYALRRSSSWAWLVVALAGPLSNLVLAILGAIPFQLGLVSMFNTRGNGLFPTPAGFLLEFVYLNLLLMLFNLIPLAPLDGEKIAVELLPPPISTFFEQIRPYGVLILLGLLFIGPRIGLPVIQVMVGVPLELMFGLLIGM